VAESDPRSAHDSARDLLALDVTPELYDEIRTLWKRHSIAEDERDLPGLLSTLTEDCVYELVRGGETWHGHEGATRFYTELLSAFPDIAFALTDIVIGPQGVFEQADVSGTHAGDWLGQRGTGERREWKVGILFPWDPTARLFTGERIWVDRDFLRA
jgi:hypothetical protein